MRMNKVSPTLCCGTALFALCTVKTDSTMSETCPVGLRKNVVQQCLALWLFDEIHVFMGYFRVTVRLMLSYQ
jgi:hypothetical protein